MENQRFLTLIALVFLTSCGRYSPTETETVSSTPDTLTILPPLTSSPSEIPPQDTITTQGRGLQKIHSISIQEYSIFSPGTCYWPSQYLSLHPNGRILASIGNERTALGFSSGIFLWNIDDFTQTLYAYESPFACPKSIAFNHKGDLLAIGGCEEDVICDRSKILLVDWNDGIIVSSINYPGSAGIQIEFSKDDSMLIIQSSTSGQLGLLDLVNGSRISNMPLNAMGANSFALSPKGDTILTGQKNGIRLINTLDLATINERNISDNNSFDVGPSVAVTISSDGKFLAAGGCGRIGGEGCELGKLFLWDMNKSDPLQILQGESGGVFSLCFNPEGNILVNGGLHGLDFWEWQTAKKIPSPYQNQELSVFQILFDPIENLFITMGEAGINLGRIDSNDSSWEYTTLEQFGIGRIYSVTMDGNNQLLHEDASETSEVSGQLQAGDRVNIVDGPVFANGKNWWLLWFIFPNGTKGNGGWITENSLFLKSVP